MLEIDKGKGLLVGIARQYVGIVNPAVVFFYAVHLLQPIGYLVILTKWTVSSYTLKSGRTHHQSSLTASLLKLWFSTTDAWKLLVSSCNHVCECACVRACGYLHACVHAYVHTCMLLLIHCQSRLYWQQWQSWVCSGLCYQTSIEEYCFSLCTSCRWMGGAGSSCDAIVLTLFLVV